MLLQGNVGLTTTSFGVGATPFNPAGNQGELLVSELHGKHFAANYRGKVFTATAAACRISGASGPIMWIPSTRSVTSPTA